MHIPTNYQNSSRSCIGSVNSVPAKQHEPIVHQPSVPSSDYVMYGGSTSQNKLPRSDIGREKYGSNANGTNAAHIASFELMNDVLVHKQGRPFSSTSSIQLMQKELNNDENLRIKTRQGNLFGNDGYSGDRALDSEIMNSYESGKPLNQKATARAKRVWNFIANSDMPTSVKKTTRAYFNSLEDTKGRKVVRKNAKYT